MKIKINGINVNIHGEYIKDIEYTGRVQCHQINCMSTNELRCNECILRSRLSVDLSEVKL